MSLRTQTLWSMLPLLSVTLANLISVPLFYRYLGAEHYGLWFYVLTLSGAFGFMDLGLGVAVGRYVGISLGNNDPSAVREYWGTGNMIAIPLLLLMAFGFCAVGAIFGPQWCRIRPGTESLLRWCFVAAAPGLFLSYYGQFWNILAQAHLDFRFLALVRTLLAIVGIAIAIWIARRTGDPLKLIWWSVVVSAIQLIAYVCHAYQSYGLGFNFMNARLQRAREMSAYTLKTFLGLLAGSLAAVADRLIFGKLVLPSEFGHYSIAGNVGSRIQNLGSSILGPVFHQSNRVVSETRFTEVRSIHSEAFSLIFGWCILPVYIVAIWRDPLLLLWLGDPLRVAVAPLFLPAIIAASLQVISSISAAQLASLNRQGSVVAFQVLGTALAVLFGLLGWRFAGTAGFAWGVALSRVANLGQDLLLMTIVGRLGWLTRSAYHILAVQSLIGVPFLILSVFIRDWRLAAAAGCFHAAIGAIPLVRLWATRRINSPLCASAE